MVCRVGQVRGRTLNGADPDSLSVPVRRINERHSLRAQTGPTPPPPYMARRGMKTGRITLFIVHYQVIRKCFDSKVCSYESRRDRFIAQT